MPDTEASQLAFKFTLLRLTKFCHLNIEGALSQCSALMVISWCDSVADDDPTLG